MSAGLAIDEIPGFWTAHENNGNLVYCEAGGHAKIVACAKPKQSKNTFMGGYVYIMCSGNNSTLYVGVTSNLPSRVMQHKEKFYPKSFSARYHCSKLVYYQWFDTIRKAITEEKRLKGGNRRQKERLINGMNPEWKDLYDLVKFF